MYVHIHTGERERARRRPAAAASDLHAARPTRGGDAVYDIKKKKKEACASDPCPAFTNLYWEIKQHLMYYRLTTTDDYSDH